MNSQSFQLFIAVIIMLSLMLLAYFLKKTGFLQKENSAFFSKLVLKISLPALILSSLVQQHFDMDYIKMALLMAIIEIIMIVMSFFIAKFLKFDKPTTGAFILVSSFGMTTMLGYPLIAEMYPNNPTAMEEAVVTSEFGVGFLLFIFGPLIAMYFGSKNLEIKSLTKSIRTFFISPVFISLILGILLSFFPLEKSMLFNDVVSPVLKHLAQANFFLVAFTIGTILEFKSIEKIYLFIILAVIMKLFLKPLLSVFISSQTHFQDMMNQIVFIETAMPSAILTAVYAKQYQCKPEWVSISIMISLIVAIISIPGLFAVFY